MELTYEQQVGSENSLGDGSHPDSEIQSWELKKIPQKLKTQACI